MIDYRCIMQYLNVSLGHSQGLLLDAMPVIVFLWRVGNGIFNCQFLAKLDKSKSLLNLSGMEVDYFFIFCLLKILITCCDIKLNLGPKKDKSCDNFSLYQWKLYLPLHIRHYMKRSPHVRHYMSLRDILRLFRSL